MPGHLGAAVPGQRPADLWWQATDRGENRVADGQRVSAGQRHEDQEPRGAFDQSCDGGLAVLPDDQVAFPVPGYGPAFDFGGTFVEVAGLTDPRSRLRGAARTGGPGGRSAAGSTRGPGWIPAGRRSTGR